MTGLLLFFLAISLGGLGLLGFFTVQIYVKSGQIQGAFDDLQSEYDNDQKTIKALRIEVQRLSKYKGIADADAKAAEMLASAQSKLELPKVDADTMLFAAQTRSDALLKEASDKAANKVLLATDTARNLQSDQ